MSKKSNYLAVLVALALNLVFLIIAIFNLSISYYEADTFFNTHKISSLISNLSCKIFVRNDFFAKLPFLVMHILNVILLYKISKNFLKRDIDRVISVVLYMFLPGVMASAILINNSVFVIFVTLSLIYLYKNGKIYLFYALLVISIFVDKSFLVLYLCFFLFGFYTKDKFLLILCTILFFIVFFIYGYDISGKPKGYFLDTMGVFAAVFSPLLFLYFIYTIYRIWVKGEKEILWFICNFTFLICLVLSFRQRLELEEFLPFCAISTPLMIKIFMGSYRVRLPQFRKAYKFLCGICVFTLFASSVSVVFNEVFYKEIYKKSPDKHFAYKFDIVKELANNLKSVGIDEIYTGDSELELRLKFYNIESGISYYLSKDNLGSYIYRFDIKKGGNIIESYFVYKFKFYEEYDIISDANL
ncbi:MAG: hypothetical protein MR902_04265 [Campylobacter sp.]|nr:hypothetical protein [Campylobacter sp.]